MAFYPNESARCRKLAIQRQKSIGHTKILLLHLKQEVSRLEGDARSDSFQEAAHGRVAFWQEHGRLLQQSKYLTDQLDFARQRLGVKQSELRAAYFRACEDRDNRQCHDCHLWRNVDLSPCFHLVCRGCSQQHMRCTSPYISTGTVGERSFGARASSLLDEISQEMRTLQEGPWYTTSIWGKEYLVHDTRRLKENCEQLKQDLANTRRKYEDMISVLNDAQQCFTKFILHHASISCVENVIRIPGRSGAKRAVAQSTSAYMPQVLADFRPWLSEYA
ncbi:hypothetical protein BBP40_004123 [Aspergillus hancockii]|nr:hypothetical protein BBP40_004123 [Aspergillus hancockii]